MARTHEEITEEVMAEIRVALAEYKGELRWIDDRISNIGACKAAAGNVIRAQR